MNSQDIVDYAKSLDCVHCGLCLQTCPTYVATGLESRSPRGRIHIMRSLAEGSASVDVALIDELDSCLLCRNCESVCPSGVEYGELLAHTREALADDSHRSWIGRQMMRLGLRTVLPSRDWIRLAAVMLSLGQRTGILKLTARFMGPLGRSSRALPPVPSLAERKPLKGHHPARGKRKAVVAMLEGCVMPIFFGRVNRATASVLQSCGRDVCVPALGTCCGALHAHNGDLEMARTLARQTIVAFDSVRETDGSPATVVVNSAGCSAQMKEYGHLLAGDAEFAERAQAFSARVRDFSEYLAQHAMVELHECINGEASTVRAPLTFDDPCHLCHAQDVRSEPRTLLDAVPTERVDLRDSESCCGSAGLYATLRPEDSREVLQPKLEALRDSGARTLVTANPGCQLQWQAGVAQAGMDVDVLHIAEVLARAIPSKDGL